MTTFVFSQTVDSAEPISAALGASGAAPLTTLDAGKALALGPNQNYLIAANGADIEGYLIGVEAYTVNQGYAFGSVGTSGCATATVDAAQVGALAIGAQVVSGTHTAANTAGGMTVTGGMGVAYKWRVVRHITGTGVAGDSVLIQEV